MVDQDVVYAKVSSIQKCLKRIKDVSQLNPDKLENLDIQEIVILNLQRAIQGTIDLAAHIIADEGLGVPSEIRENFNLLQKEEILSEELTKKVRKMVGFRNIAVHEYQSIDVEILKSILKNNLADIEEFYLTVLRHYNLSK